MYSPNGLSRKLGSSWISASLLLLCPIGLLVLVTLSQSVSIATSLPRCPAVSQALTISRALLVTLHCPVPLSTVIRHVEPNTNFLSVRFPRGKFWGNISVVILITSLSPASDFLGSFCPMKSHNLQPGAVFFSPVCINRFVYYFSLFFIIWIMKVW